MFKFSENVTGYVGRNSYRLFIPRMRSTYGQKSLFDRGVYRALLKSSLLTDAVFPPN